MGEDTGRRFSGCYRTLRNSWMNIWSFEGKWWSSNPIDFLGLHWRIQRRRGTRTRGRRRQGTCRWSKCYRRHWYSWWFRNKRRRRSVGDGSATFASSIRKELCSAFFGRHPPRFSDRGFRPSIGGCVRVPISSTTNAACRIGFLARKGQTEPIGSKRDKSCFGYFPVRLLGGPSCCRFCPE